MHPQQRGFDEFFGFLGGRHSYFQSSGILRGTAPVQELNYTTDAFGREAVDFIERHSARPWFLYLAFNAVHIPMHATDARLARFSNVKDKQRQTYNAMMLAMDDAIGAVRRKLAESGLEKDTLVAFISDNGGPTMKGTSVNGSSNAPLRGSKRTTLEGGIRVPFLVSWPGHVQPGVYEQPVIQLDLYSTALAVAGVEVKPDWKLDGVNLLPFVSGENPGKPHDALYWRLGGQMAIRAGDFKLVRYDSNADTQTGQVGQPVTNAKLYNLRDDIGETNDLAAAMPARLQEMQTKWNAWNATLAKPLWGEGSDGATRRIFLIGMGVLALFCTGVGLGMFVQQRLQIGVAAAAAQPFLDFARGLSAEGAERGPAPTLEHWRYPGAVEHGRGRGSSLVINGQTVTPASEYLVLATADDYQEVAAHYGSKLGFRAAGDFGLSAVINKTSTEAGIQLALADGQDPGLASAARPVSVLCLRQTCASYSAAAFITRAEKETHTHVIFLYDPKVISSDSPP
jgi:hypothetical protein